MMLIFSFLALVLACVLMYLELKEYDFDIEAKQYQSAYLNPTVATDAETVASFWELIERAVRLTTTPPEYILRQIAIFS